MKARESRDRRKRIERIRKRWRGRVATNLCDRGLVTEQVWKKMFLQLVEDVSFAQGEIGRIGDPTDDIGFDPREPLVWTWCVLDTMPNDQDQRYQALRERAADGTGIEDRADAMRQRGYAITGLPTALALQVPWLASLARVLDDDLAGLQYWPEDVVDWTPADWRPPGYGCFVVPVRREHRLADGRPVQRRGLLYHAVVPERIGSLRVELHLHPDAAVRDVGADPADWVFGSATFPGMTVVPVETGGDGFRLADAPLAGDEAAVVAAQVDAAREAGTDVMVWPELTMPTRRLDLLMARLAAAPLAGGRIPLVVAGSWHVVRTPVEDGGEADSGDGPDRHVNRSEVMLGHGEPLLSYDKRRRYPYAGLTEDIGAGRTLPVVVMEDCLVGIAICRDNCDDNAKETYRDLPIDLVIVPSMGAGSTVEAHERHAKGQRSRQGTVTVVVQQNLAVDGEPALAGPPAFSFVRPEEGGRPGLGQAEAFRTLDRVSRA
jgi:predicted amidohydrolase